MPRPELPFPALLRRRTGEALRGWAGDARRWRSALAALLWPPRPRHAAAAFALAVAAAGLGGLSFQRGLAGRLPSDLDWRAAAAVLERDARPGDAVALSPRWAGRARLALPPWLPVLDLPADPAEPLWGVRRVWLLSLPDAPGAGGAARALAARSAGGEAPQRLGALALSRHDLAAPELPVAFLPDLLARASVRLGGTPCPGAGGAFRCGHRSGVAREVREVAGLPRPCIVLAPDAGAPLTVELSGLPAGRVISGHAGLPDGAGAARGPAIRLEVRAGPAGTGVAVDGPGWRPFELPAGGTGAVSLTVPPVPGPARLLCVDAAVLP